ncbi:MAG: ferredoxin reductase [Solirubrobacteraceae bacterium]
MGRLAWAPGEIAEVRWETNRVKSLAIDVPSWSGHRAGQHVDLRLTAQDGYQTVRSYSLSSPPGAGRVTVTVERIDDGEVSPYLVDEARPGDRLELRGPLGGYFVWEPAMGGPLMLVAGGSGVVPLAAMIRHWDAADGEVSVKLLYSSRSEEDAIFRAELDGLAASSAALEVVHTFTRSAPTRWAGYRRRIDREMLADVAWPASSGPLAYVCGPTRLVEQVAGDLLALGYRPDLARTERFGPTGGS